MRGPGADAGGPPPSTSSPHGSGTTTRQDGGPRSGGAALAELRRVLGVVRAAEADRADAADWADRVEAPQPGLADLTMCWNGWAPPGWPSRGRARSCASAPRGVDLSAYRIVQEALSNVLRHAPGSHVRVELTYARIGLGSSIVNGPATHRAPAAPDAGHGVTDMRERVAVLGGRLAARPTDEGGFGVSAFLPCGGTGAADD